jgi:hypothetical protein
MQDPVEVRTRPVRRSGGSGDGVPCFSRLPTNSPRHYRIRGGRQPVPWRRRPAPSHGASAPAASRVYLRSVSDSFMIFTLEMFTPQGGNSLGVKKLSESFE